MALTPKNLYRGQPGTSNTTLYTAPNTVGKYAIVKEVIACNTDSVDRSLWFFSVASGGSASTNNVILDTANVPAKTTVFFEMSTVLAQNESIQAKASSAATITLTVSGVESP